MQSFNHFLRTIGASNDLRSILYHLARSVKYINFSIRAGNTGRCGTQNSSGEDQLALDVSADKIIAGELEKSELVALIVSEEQDGTQVFPAPRGRFAVAYDPLDGSSLVDCNLAIGSIFGIWEGDQFLGKKGNDLVAAAYAVYGPRITLVIAVRDLGVHEFELNDVGEFILTRKNLKIAPKSEFFAPGNCRACLERPEYKKWLDDCIFSGKTLRYSGGMTPDLHHILSKGGGVFAYPAHSKYPAGKLRLLFECAPFAFIFAEADGDARTEYGDPILDVECGEIHQRSTIFIGSSDEVSRAIKIVSDHRNTN